MDLGYALFRMAWVAAGLALLAAGWKRLSPRRTLAAILLLHLAAWVAYVIPLGRLYGLEEHRDRGFMIGMVATVAAGGSPFEHTQVRYGSLEPFWGALLAVFTGFEPARALPVYQLMTPLGLLLVGVCVYSGWRDGTLAGEWEAVLLAYAVLGLSSISMSQDVPLPLFWAGSFLLKPNHTAALGLAVLAMGGVAKGWNALRLGLVLGVAAWMFLLPWAYLLPGLALAVLFFGLPWMRGRVAAAIALSAVIVAPFVMRLARDYAPQSRGESSVQVWRDSLGARLAEPHWVTLDLGLVFPLAVVALWGLTQRKMYRDRVLLGVAAATGVSWVVYAIGAVAGFSPEPDEFHYWCRFVAALLAGIGLTGAAEHIERWRGLATGRGALIVMAALLPLNFPAWYHPPTMDRYFKWSLAPIPARVLDYGAWVRDNVPRDAVFAAGPSACIWIPALSGRHVLLVEDSRPPADYLARDQAQKVLFTSDDPAAVQAAARQHGVTHVAIDDATVEKYTKERVARALANPAYEMLFQNAKVRILRVR